MASRRAAGWRWRSASGRRSAPVPPGVLAMSPFVPPGLLGIDLEGARDVPVLLQHGTATR